MFGRIWLDLIFSDWHKCSSVERTIIVARLDNLLNQEAVSLEHINIGIVRLVEEECYLPTLKRLVRLALEQDPNLFLYDNPVKYIMPTEMHCQEPIQVRRFMLASVPVPEKYFRKETYRNWAMHPSDTYVDALVRFRDRLERSLTLWVIMRTFPSIPKDLRILLVGYVKRRN